MVADSIIEKVSGQYNSVLRTDSAFLPTQKSGGILWILHPTGIQFAVPWMFFSLAPIWATYSNHSRLTIYSNFRVNHAIRSRVQSKCSKIYEFSLIILISPLWSRSQLFIIISSNGASDGTTFAGTTTVCYQFYKVSFWNSSLPFFYLYVKMRRRCANGIPRVAKWLQKNVPSSINAFSLLSE